MEEFTNLDLPFKKIISFERWLFQQWLAIALVNNILLEIRTKEKAYLVYAFVEAEFYIRNYFWEENTNLQKAVMYFKAVWENRLIY